MRCSNVEREIVRGDTGMSSLSVGARRHLEGCANCKQFQQKTDSVVDDIRSLEPQHLSEQHRDQLITKATVKLDSVDGGSRSRLIPRYLYLLPMVAAAVAIVLTLRTSEKSEWLAIAPGLMANSSKLDIEQNIPWDEEITAPQSHDVVVVAQDGSKITAAKQARFVMVKPSKKREKRCKVIEGQLSFVVEAQQDEPFYVQTDEMRVEVKGTRFVVTRKQQEQVTCVRVEEGLVRTTVVSSQEKRELGVGQQQCTPREKGGSPRDASVQSSLVQTQDAGLIEREDGGEQPTKTHLKNDANRPSNPTATEKSSAKQSRNRLKQIRKQLRSRNISDARNLIAEVKRNTSSRRVHAELDMLAAEADVVEGKFQAAYAKYRKVSKRYGKMQQAQIALFAAIELARKGRVASASLQNLVAEYLKRFPDGMFAQEVEQLSH